MSSDGKGYWERIVAFFEAHRWIVLVGIAAFLLGGGARDMFEGVFSAEATAREAVNIAQRADARSEAAMDSIEQLRRDEAARAERMREDLNSRLDTASRERQAMFRLMSRMYCMDQGNTEAECSQEQLENIRFPGQGDDR